MFNLLLALITGLVIGWNFHSFFMQLNPPTILKNDINISQTPKENKPKKVLEETKVIEKNITAQTVIKETPISKEISNHDSFYNLLEKNLFSDAMALYLDSENEKLPNYRSELVKYFQIKSTTSPIESIIEMLEFSELEPKHTAVNFELIKTYKSIKEYKKAVDLITRLIDSESVSEQEKLYPELIETSLSYINELNSSKSFENLVSFLESQIELGIKSSFYTYSLAKHYVEVEHFEPAIRLLKELEYDYNYGEQAKDLLNLINKKITQNNEYTQQIALKKVGEHFTVEVEIDNLPLTLLLDTGATLTMVNEEKISSLALIKENITLNTAGGVITAELQEADIFSVGDIQLEKFKIVSSSFEQKNADGLLGMNFFKKFKFKIDQEKAILYLSPKV